MHIMAVVLIGLTSTGTLNARTSGDDDDYKTKTYDVGTISSIDANGLFSVIYEQTSGETDVSVKAKDKVFECLDVKNDDGMLVLKLNLKDGKSYTLPPIEVKVRTKHLTYVELSGSGSFTCESGIKTESLKIRSSGAGSVEINDLSAKNSIEIMTSGAGKVNLDGAKAKDLSVEMNGAGKVEVQGIESKTATAIIREGRQDHPRRQDRQRHLQAERSRCHRCRIPESRQRPFRPRRHRLHPVLAPPLTN